MGKILNSCHPDDDFHYEKMGLTRDKIELWEDGMRTDGSRGTYEWWYYDSHFPDGTVMVIIFYSKSPIEVNGPIKPQATIEITLPDGTKYSDIVTADIKESFYSKDKCDVKIGESSFSGDLKHYDIVYEGKKIKAKVSLDSTLAAWRSQTGSIFFGDNEEYYFAWLPAVPEGKVVADVNIEGKDLHLEGSGYHDHNWGNAIMLKLMHHWYWGRAKIGDYKVISSWITAEKKYGYKDFDVFLLAKGDKVLGDNRNHTLKFVPTDEYTDDYTGKPVYGKVIYEYTTEEGEEYRITYERKGDIARQNFVDTLSGITKFGAKLIGFSSSYLRFEGIASVEKIENGKVVEKVEEPSAVWELMYFGKAGADKNK
ncbi:MAG: hypothetical protein IJ306_03820 [Oscillospiraceae bacterium]|nr:hypothetical protein [Oscillospiraceae bacterium]